MSSLHFPKSLGTFLVFVLATCHFYAHNGAIAYAYPMEPVAVDADLSDWPAGLEKYPIAFGQYGFKPESADDIRGYFVIGYNEALQEIYVGVEMEDDSYIRNRENPQFWAHDMQVLYIDPRHKAQGSAVLALEVNEYFRKIVDQEANWDPFVLNANWEMVEVIAKNSGKKTIYEWKIKLDGYVNEGSVLGFDYVVFDKDSKDGNSNTVGWGPDEGIKHQCSKCLGDIMLLPSGTEFGTVAGRINSDRDGILPRQVRLKTIENPDIFLNTMVDTNGYFKTKVPAGEYTAEIPNALVETDDAYYRIAGKNSLNLETMPSGDVNTEVSLEVAVLPPPDLLPDRGILYDFGEVQEKQLNDFVEAYRDYYGIPGVSLALIKDGKLFYKNTYGYKNNFSKEPVVEETLFEAASITKPVFSYVVLRLAERGEIDLDKPLFEYLPFEDLEEYPEYKKMTGRHVLIHRTGLPNWGREMKFTPGEKYGYSGEGFEYLKRVVVHITGKKITDLVDQELIVPQGIRHMEFQDSPELREVVANGHINESPTVQFLPSDPGMAWSMYTEAAAFSDFAITLLDRKGLQPETFEEMMTIHTEWPEDNKIDKNRQEGSGLGIAILHTEHGKVFGHSGSNGDFKCLFVVYEELGMGYIMFTNSNTGDVLTDVMSQLLVEGKQEEEHSSSGGN